MKDKLFKRDFTLVVIGQVISIFGSAILRFALNLYVLDLTGRADVFALVIALSALPGIVLSPVGGAIADRFNRRNLMVIFDFCSSATVLVLFFLIRMQTASVVAVGVIVAVLSLISSVYQPTVQASIPQLASVENLEEANGVVNGVGALAGLLGPVLGGVLYAALGLNTLVAASCAAFFLSAVMEIFIHIPFEKQERTGNIVAVIAGDMKTGAQYIVKENPRILKIMLIAAALNMFMSPFFIIGVPYILRVAMQSSEVMYGIGMGAGELSTILGALAVGIFAGKLRLSELYKVLLLAAGLILPIAFAVTPFALGLGYWPSFVIFFIFASAIMFLLTLISVFVLTSVQKETPNEMLGKVMAIIMAAAQCSAPLGQALYGIAFERFDAVYLPVLFACALTFLIAVAARKMLGEPQNLPEKNYSPEQ